MTEKVLLQSRELERAAEKAGGYVATPGSLKVTAEGMRQFSAIRQHSLRHNKPVSKLTSDDYRKIGIKR